MEQFDSFTTTGGYQVEFYDAPETVDASELQEYAHLPEDMEKVLRVPFLVRLNDDIGNFWFVTGRHGDYDVGIAVPADKEAGIMIQDMHDSGDLDEIEQEMDTRFLFAEDKPVPSMDDVLDKITASGMESLSDTQREVLNKESNMLNKANESANGALHKFVPLFEEFVDSYMDRAQEPDGSYFNRPSSAKTADIPGGDAKKIEWKYDAERGEWYAHIEGPVSGRYFQRWKKSNPKPTSPPDEMNEKWQGADDVEQTGEYADKTIAELQKMKDGLMSKDNRTDAEQTKVRQINFAIRSKRGWKDGAQKK
jgi:hypothetical protein